MPGQRWLEQHHVSERQTGKFGGAASYELAPNWVRFGWSSIMSLSIMSSSSVISLLWEGVYFTSLSYMFFFFKMRKYVNMFSLSFNYLSGSDGNLH
jgi:hypothetical protein